MPNLLADPPNACLFQGMMREQRLAPHNTTLVRAGDLGIKVRMITAGWAFRYWTLPDGRRQILNLLLPGDVFGLETLFDEPVGAAVQTATVVRYLAIAPTDLAVAIDESGVFRKRVSKLLLAERVMLEDWIIRLGQCNAEERTVGMLLLLHSRLTLCGLISGPSFKLELTQHEIADLLGLHVIHLNRVLGRLRGRGLLAMAGGIVTLLDHDGLLELVPPLRSPGLPAWVMEPVNHDPVRPRMPPN